MPEPIIMRGYVGEVDLKRSEIRTVISVAFGAEVVYLKFHNRDSVILKSVAEKFGMKPKGKDIKVMEETKKPRINIVIG